MLALLAPLAAPASAQTDLRILMRQKLELAQRLFGAVVLGRLPAVERDAAELVRISETAAWMTAPTPEYFTHADEFQEAARDLAGGRIGGRPRRGVLRLHDHRRDLRAVSSGGAAAAGAVRRPPPLGPRFTPGTVSPPASAGAPPHFMDGAPQTARYPPNPLPASRGDLHAYNAPEGPRR